MAPLGQAAYDQLNYDTRVPRATRRDDFVGVTFQMLTTHGGLKRRPVTGKRSVADGVLCRPARTVIVRQGARACPGSRKGECTPNIMTVVPEQVSGLRKLFSRRVPGRYGGVVPGVFQVLAVDLGLARPTGALYGHLHLGKSSPRSCLEFASRPDFRGSSVGGGTKQMRAT